MQKTRQVLRRVSVALTERSKAKRSIKTELKTAQAVKPPTVSVSPSPGAEVVHSGE